MPLTRRAAASLLATGILFAPVRVLAAACRRIVGADPGPFYPVDPIPYASDLLTGTLVRDRSVTILYLLGRVTNGRCEPIAGAEVEIWQCDPGGEYKHPRSGRKRPLLPGFLYFAKVRSARDGGFRFRTLRPVPYEVFGLRRASHIHLRVEAPGSPVVTTEVYFAGAEDDDLRLRDRVFLGRGAGRQEMVVTLRPASEARQRLGIAPEPGALVCEYDVALPVTPDRKS